MKFNHHHRAAWRPQWRRPEARDQADTTSLAGMGDRRDRGGSSLGVNGSGAANCPPPPAMSSLSQPMDQSSSGTSNRSAFIGPVSKSDRRPRSRALAHARQYRAMDPRFSSSIHVLLRERQRRGLAGGFVAREGAGVWSPDPVTRAFASDPSVLRRLELSGTLAGHTGCVNTVSCTPDGQYWITGSDDTDLMVGVPFLTLSWQFCVALRCVALRCVALRCVALLCNFLYAWAIDGLCQSGFPLQVY